MSHQPDIWSEAFIWNEKHETIIYNCKLYGHGEQNFFLLLHIMDLLIKKKATRKLRRKQQMQKIS